MTTRKLKKSVYCENLGQKVYSLVSAPGKAEEKAGYPLAGLSKYNHDTIVGMLRYKGEWLIRGVNLSIDNACDKPLYIGKNGPKDKKTEATDGEILADANLARLNEEITENCELVIAWGNKAKLAAEAVKARYGRNFDIVYTDHPSPRKVNSTYESKKNTPKERNLERLSKIAQKLKDNSKGKLE